MNLNQPVVFLLTALPGEATAFYRDTLALNFIGDDGFALVFTTGPVMLRIGKVQSHSPASHTVLGWEVPDVASSVRDLIEKGIAFERYPGMGQDENGIATFPNGDRVAWFRDPDGNILSLSQHASA